MIENKFAVTLSGEQPHAGHTVYHAPLLSQAKQAPQCCKGAVHAGGADSFGQSGRRPFLPVRSGPTGLLASVLDKGLNQRFVYSVKPRVRQRLEFEQPSKLLCVKFNCFGFRRASDLDGVNEPLREFFQRGRWRTFDDAHLALCECYAVGGLGILSRFPILF
jgi:hypothetical protein